MEPTHCDTEKNGVIVFLDALGTRNHTIEESKKFCYRKKKFLDEAIQIWNTRDVEFKQKLNMILPEPEIATFQDSIVICWSDNEQKELSLPILFSAGQWLTDAIPLAISKYDLFFRGAISYGKYIFDSSPQNVTILGPAFTDAYNCHDLTDWMGVIQTPNCQKQYISLLKIIAEKDGQPLLSVMDYYHFLFIPYSVPLHEKNSFSVSSMDFYSVSWPQMSIRIEKESSISKILLEKCFSEDPRYKSKYCNAYAFQKWYKESSKFISPPSK